MTATVPVALDAAQAARLDAIARTRELAPADLLSEAVTAYLAHHDWFAAEVEKGRESARTEPLHTLEEIKQKYLGREAIGLDAAE